MIPSLQLLKASSFGLVAKPIGSRIMNRMEKKRGSVRLRFQTQRDPARVEFQSHLRNSSPVILVDGMMWFCFWTIKLIIDYINVAKSRQNYKLL